MIPMLSILMGSTIHLTVAEAVEEEIAVHVTAVGEEGTRVGLNVLVMVVGRIEGGEEAVPQVRRKIEGGGEVDLRHNSGVDRDEKFSAFYFILYLSS